MKPTLVSFLNRSLCVARCAVLAAVMFPVFPRLGILANVSTQRTALWRMAGFGGAALLFSVLIIAVRVRWVPLESLDHSIADALNAAVAPDRFLVQLMGAFSRLGSFG